MLHDVNELMSYEHTSLWPTYELSLNINYGLICGNLQQIIKFSSSYGLLKAQTHPGPVYLYFYSNRAVLKTSLVAKKDLQLLTNMFTTC